MRHTTFLLCNCKELDLQHNHSLYFSSYDKQISYFMSKRLYAVFHQVQTGSGPLCSCFPH